MRLIDSSGSATDTFRPSKAYAQLVGSPEYKQAVSQATKNSTRGNFGAFLAGAPGVNRFDDGLINYTNAVGQTFTEYRNAETTATRAAAKRYATNPIQQAGMILGCY